MHEDDTGGQSTSGLVVLGTAALAVACCLGVSLLAAVGGAGLLALAGVALPTAALIAIGAWTAWHVTRSRQGTGGQ
ncbi:MAG: hypothetical protein HY262_14425 [Chloroflexi bacterium]|jgi:hypothetical protein|nr:hypothetical protein [Chloroflexota bacterium]